MTKDPERLARIQDELGSAKLDALVCSLPANVLLISGYWPVVGTALALVTRDGRVIVIAPEDEIDFARDCGAKVLTFRSGSLDEIRTAIDAIQGPLAAALNWLDLERAAVGVESGAGFEPASYAAMHLYGPEIARLLGELLPSARIIPADKLFARLRTIKTGLEIDRIRIACSVASRAYKEGAAKIRPGLTETEAAGFFRVPLSTVGPGPEGVKRADGYVFCMSGENAAGAHGAYARSTQRRIGRGDFVLTHCNSYADGYWTDITRTYHLGPVDAARARMYEAVGDACSAAVAELRPGARASDVDRAARDLLRDRGFDGAFKHPTGHGAGFAAISHNAHPRLHPRSDEVLETGMVFNVEPAVYLDSCGLRHCNMFALTSNGAELLTPFQNNATDLILEDRT
jgi:Xaa-Pro dipeptidase